MGKISLGSTDIKKLALAALDIKKVSLGDVALWTGVDRGSYLLLANTVLPNSSTARTALPLTPNTGAGYDSFPLSSDGLTFRLPAGNYVLNMGWTSGGYRTDWKAGGILMPTGEVVGTPTPYGSSAGPMTWSLPFTMVADGDASIIASVSSSAAGNRTVYASNFSATITPA